MSKDVGMSFEPKSIHSPSASNLPVPAEVPTARATHSPRHEPQGDRPPGSRRTSLLSKVGSLGVLFFQGPAFEPEKPLVGCFDCPGHLPELLIVLRSSVLGPTHLRFFFQATRNTQNHEKQRFLSQKKRFFRWLKPGPYF